MGGWRRATRASRRGTGAEGHQAGGDEKPKVRFREPEPETRKAARKGGAFKVSGGGGGNRTHVRGTSVAGFSVCSRLFYLASWSVSWQPSARPARKISATAVGRDGNPARLTSSIPDQRAEPREGRGYLSSQCVVVIGSCSCLHPFNERMTLDTLPTTETVPRQTQYAPKLDSQGHFSRQAACCPCY